ncbi:hypothetical protein O181_031532 [Austropuccinia psidii MF-1]|uniref:Uncharacterized protein n=1 Tax=Austropuccinia psidii MF-1 TaxID=1389203 RepID=A0A9Q3H5F5_9BASI|nr:hypothetical protein [Austropuccinia psidii MF-1]
MGVYRKSSMNPIYGQLSIPSFSWQIGPCWCLMGFGKYPISLATHGLRPYPAVIGLLGQFSTSPPTPRPPTASMACSLWDPLGTFWPKSNEAKRGQGDSPLNPKARWVSSHKRDHLGPFWPKMAKRTPGPQIGHNQL